MMKKIIRLKIPIDVESKILKNFEACNYEYENKDNNITDDDNLTGIIITLFVMKKIYINYLNQLII